MDLHILTGMVRRQLGLVSLIIPFWLVAAQAGWRGMLGVWWACLVTGGHKDSPDVGTVLRAVFWHSLAMATIMGVLVMLQDCVFKWMVVVPPAVPP